MSDDKEYILCNDPICEGDNAVDRVEQLEAVIEEILYNVPKELVSVEVCMRLSFAIQSNPLKTHKGK